MSDGMFVRQTPATLELIESLLGEAPNSQPDEAGKLWADQSDGGAIKYFTPAITGSISGDTAYDHNDTIELAFTETGPPRGKLTSDNRTPSDQDSITLSFVENSTTYHWYCDGVLVDTTNEPTLEIANATVANAGDYTLVVTDNVHGISETFGPYSVTVEPAGPPTASGGTETEITVESTDYKLHEFNVGTDTLTVENDNLTVTALIVAGGGGSAGGDVTQTVTGGGGGGQVIEQIIELAPGDYTIVVGDGGDGGDPTATDGGNSSAFGFIAVGGKASNGRNSVGADGYNASGASVYTSAANAAGGTGTNYSGGDSTNYAAGGGAGQRGNGGDALVNNGGNGGAGVDSDITGSSVGYGGGGAGAGRYGFGGVGGEGTHGGGNGADGSDGPQGTAGAANTGGGAGGRCQGGTGNDGGSGVVYVRWEL